MSDVLVRALGWRATMFHGDPCVVDRWIFARRHLRPGPVRTLDAGAGNGSFALMAGSKGNHVVALSFAEDELARAQRRANSVRMTRVVFRIGDLRRLSTFRDELGTFDQILCLEVIEHLNADQELVRLLAGLLRPGGQLLISAPSARHRPLFCESLSSTEDGGHVRWGYSSEQLTAMLEAAGLSVVAQGEISGYVSQKLTNLMRRGQRITPGVGWLVVLPLRLVQLLDRPVTHALRWPFLSVTAVAVRPS
jgi:SAM-dependent methyltransferase